jgi:proteasome accessory factor A
MWGEFAPLFYPMKEQQPTPRIIGTEVEYGLVWNPAFEEFDVSPDIEEESMDVRMSDDLLERILSRMNDHLPPYIAHHDSFLSNGSRLYIDIGLHPEYATPECTTLEQVVAHEFAGEELVLSALQSMAANKLIEDDFRLHKRVLASNDELNGAHESYLTGADFDPAEPYLTNALGLHFITRSILTGAGSYDMDLERWSVTQKLQHLDEETFASAHMDGHRPVVDIRNEPLADDMNWRRLHVSLGDANISPWALRMKIGTTSIGLKMLEEGVAVDDLFLEEMLEAAQLVSADTGLTKKLQLKNGTEMTALQLQRELLGRAIELSNRIPFTSEEQHVLHEWRAACEDAAESPLLLKHRADWATKMYISEEAAALRDPNKRHQNLAALDLKYDMVGAKNGIGRKLRQNGHFRWSINPKLIENAKRRPPHTTRASLRGRLILASMTDRGRKQLGEVAGFNWDSIAFENGAKYPFPNPYATTDILVAGDTVNQKLPKFPS